MTACVFTKMVAPHITTPHKLILCVVCGRFETEASCSLKGSRSTAPVEFCVFAGVEYAAHLVCVLTQDPIQYFVASLCDPLFRHCVQLHAYLFKYFFVIVVVVLYVRYGAPQAIFLTLCRCVFLGDAHWLH